jgi:hypothetical protein
VIVGTVGFRLVLWHEGVEIFEKGITFALKE